MTLTCGICGVVLPEGERPRIVRLTRQIAECISDGTPGRRGWTVVSEVAACRSCAERLTVRQGARA